VRGVGAALAGKTARAQGIGEGLNQGKELRRFRMRSAPQDAGARPVADAGQAEVEGGGPDVLRRCLVTGPSLGQDLAEEGECDVQVFGVRHTAAPEREPVLEPDQGGALGLAGP